jgi:hypothetical protein
VVLRFELRPSAITLVKISSLVVQLSDQEFAYHAGGLRFDPLLHWKKKKSVSLIYVLHNSMGKGITSKQS